MCFHFAAVAARSSGVNAWSLEKSFIQRNGRQASMMARELVKSPCWRRSGGIRGSMGLLQLPNPFDIGDAALFQFVPNFGGAKKQRQVTVEWIDLQIADDGDNRICAVINAFDVDDWCRTSGGSIVTRPFAE